MPNAAAPIRVFSGTDSAVMRAGLRALLEGEEDISVVGEAPSIAGAIALSRGVPVDVVLVDVRDPSTLNLRPCAEAGRQGRGCRTIVLAPRTKEETILALIRDGAAGYLFDDAKLGDLANAVRLVHAGGVQLDPDVATIVVDRLRAPSGSLRPPLTIGEIEVLERIAHGETNVQIGRGLSLRDKVVKHRVSSILKKVGVRNRVAAAAWWVRHPQRATQPVRVAERPQTPDRQVSGPSGGADPEGP